MCIGERRPTCRRGHAVDGGQAARITQLVRDAAAAAAAADRRRRADGVEAAASASDNRVGHRRPLELAPLEFKSRATRFQNRQLGSLNPTRILHLRCELFIADLPRSCLPRFHRRLYLSPTPDRTLLYPGEL